MRKSVDNVNHIGTPGAACDAPAGQADAVLDLIHTVMHQFRSLQYQALRGGPHDITHMESKVLGYFARHPQATQSDLAQYSGRDKAQLARLVKGLRERGLLAACADAADRRHVHLHLTADGQAVQQGLRATGQRLNERAVAGLSAQQQALLLDLLVQVRDNLDRAG